MASPSISQQNIIRNAPRRMGTNERWEYQCLTCKVWMPPSKFKKRGKRSEYPRPTCKRCEQRLVKWETESKGKQLAATAWRRERMIRAASQPNNEIEQIYAKAAHITRETGSPHHIDHEIPLRSDLVCGLHVLANLRVMRGVENVRKGNSFTPYYETPDGHRRFIEEDSAYIKNVAPKRVLVARVVKPR